MLSEYVRWMCPYCVCKVWYQEKMLANMCSSLVQAAKWLFYLLTTSSSFVFQIFLFKMGLKIHENLLAPSLHYLGYPIPGCQCILTYYVCLKVYDINLYSFLSENIIYYVWKVWKDAWFSRLTYFIARLWEQKLKHTYIFDRLPWRYALSGNAWFAHLLRISAYGHGGYISYMR